jgi:hypothetical protein
MRSTCRRTAGALLAGLVALALAGSARAQEPAAPAEASETAAKPDRKHKKKRTPKPPDPLRSDGLHLRGRARIGAGAQHGQRERPDDFAPLSAGGMLEPSLRAGALVLALPLALEQRETPGAQLRRTRGSAQLQADYRIARPLRVSAFARLAFTLRPDWPDLYQPVGSDHRATDRYSYWTRSAGLGLTVHPARKHWLRADYDYALADYATDPAFDAIGRPNHLTPFDYDKHTLDIDYHYSTGGVRLGAGASGFLRDSFFVFARDAHTGFTHAGPGGPPANPLQRLRGLTPRVELKLDLVADRLALELRYAHELQEDTFAGYYSFAGPNPRLALLIDPLPSLQLHAAVELWLRRYGPDSYRQGIGHPPLDNGDRRYDRRVQASLGGELALGGPFALTLDARYTHRRTNFPDYEPAVFPASQAYAIDWDYDDLLIAAGLQAEAAWF